MTARTVPPSESPAFVRLSATYAVSAQLDPGDLATVAAAGFRSVINHRPDGEGGASQPSSDVLCAAAGRSGLAYAHQPVAAIGLDEVARFAALIRRLPAPVLAFCRTGTRSRRLHELAAASGDAATAAADIGRCRD